MGKAIISIIGIAIFAIIGQAQTAISGARWELTELNGRKVTNSRAYMEFDVPASRFSGNAGCNMMFGGYELTGQRFKAKQVGTTRMACTGNGTARAENEFLEALKNANRLRRNGNTLTIRTTGERVVLRFQRAWRLEGETATQQLAGKKWLLRSIGGERVNLRRNAPFLNFDSAKGSAGGDSGCNSFGGEYEAVGTSIKFGNLIQTMRACEFEDRMTIERGFMGALEAADRFRITGNRLEIMKGAKVLLEFEGVAK
jgi:heat shock protein HslJ